MGWIFVADDGEQVHYETPPEVIDLEFTLGMAKATIKQVEAERDALREKLEKPNWQDYMEITKAFLTFYPPDIFDGSSGDPGPLFVVALRNAVKELNSEEG